MNSKSINYNLINKMTNDEQYAFDYLSSINQTWANLFQEVLLESRDKISQRLISSLYRENLVQSHQHSKIIDNKDVGAPQLSEENKLLSIASVSYTHLTLPTTCNLCRSRWSPYH